MQLYNIIRSAGGGEIVKNLAAGSGLEPSEVEEALRALLARDRQRDPARGREPERRRRGPCPDARRALPALLRQPAGARRAGGAADGERVLDEILDQDERGELVRRVAAAIRPDEGQVRTLLPRVAVLAAAVLGERLREPPPAPAPSELGRDPVVRQPAG